jgi:DNA-directed RNA polymerase subunit omega
MLKPLKNDIIKNDESYYSFVVGIAKRARQISEFADNEKLDKIPEEYSTLTLRASEEKPVSLAMEEYSNGEFTIKM